MCFYCDREAKGNPQPWWYVNYVCWNCHVQNGVKKDETNNKKKGGRICYRCHAPMVNVGFKFKTPKKNNSKQWEVLQKTWENQYVTIQDEQTYVGPLNKKVKQKF
jgi:hypothetical protein